MPQTPKRSHLTSASATPHVPQPTPAASATADPHTPDHATAPGPDSRTPPHERTAVGASDAGERATVRSWLAVLTVAIGIFSVVTTEMLPVGLLTSIGSSLHISDGMAGLAMTLPGLVAAVAAPLLAVTIGRLDRKRVLCALMVLLIGANLLSAIAPTFSILLIARVLVGLSIGGVWSIAAGLAVRLVPERSVPAATSVIFSGIAVASVLGVPAGTLIGDLADWRAAFWVMAALALAILVAMVVLLPPLPANQSIRLRELPALLRNPTLRVGLITTALLVTGHFGAYTYIRPVLEEVSGVGSGLISTLLLVYGVAGIAGNFLAGARAGRDPRGTLMLLSALLTVAVVLIAVVGDSTPGVIVLLVVWGLAYGGVSVSAQGWMLRAAPQAREVGSALFVSVFNLAIALGALLGGRAADGIAMPSVLWFGGALAVLALANLWVFGGRVMPRQR
ncbi:MFS transporter [Streptomyces zagrosensis]|uniref:Putative MFS family arabinose efflux permease n=1 Tax=Streptomyces zagrosensis TaxID=1042984 RepID=A0A7W9QB05_9ACTN|nr:MFS transporter [Streptomyces zagrosensis]MBB5935722.1 putative MFS family arabinose efflux permease [Streptomyces zagrosensis]